MRITEIIENNAVDRWIRLDDGRVVHSTTLLCWHPSGDPLSVREQVDLTVAWASWRTRTAISPFDEPPEVDLSVSTDSSD